MWNTIVELYRNYSGSGLLTALFLAALFYLWVTEKEKHIKAVLVYASILILGLFFNPLFARAVYTFLYDEIYYRLLWLLPQTAVTAYACTRLYSRLSKKSRPVLAVVLAVMIMMSGSYVYQNPYFSPAENRYHMPAEVVEICDAIHVEGREVMAVFPMELLQYVRQYDTTVCMPYGREMTVERWGNTHPLYQVMENGILEAKPLAKLAREAMCHYIVIPTEKEMTGTLEKYKYKVFMQTEHYTVYLDTTAYLGLDYQYAG